MRKIREELGLTVKVGRLLVVDWAPAPTEGDELLFIFDAGTMSADDQDRIVFKDGEVTEYRFIAPDNLDGYGPDRLTRRILTAATNRTGNGNRYAEHGSGQCRRRCFDRLHDRLHSARHHQRHVPDPPHRWTGRHT